MKFHGATIGVIIVTLIALTSIGYINSLSNEYEGNVDFEELNMTEKRLLDTQERMDKTYGDLKNMTLDTEGLDIVNVPVTMIKTAWRGVLLAFGSWTTTVVIVEEMGSASFIKLPDYVIPAITALIIVVLVIIILGVIFKWKWED